MAAVLNKTHDAIANSAPPKGNPFANCGAGEAGIEVLDGEGDSPFSQPWCCGNTTWSSFKYRIRASRNFAFDPAPDAKPPAAGGLSNATQCEWFFVCACRCLRLLPALFSGTLWHCAKSAAGAKHYTSPDCFSFCFNQTYAPGNSTYFEECAKYSAADERTGWRRFDPSGVTAWGTTSHKPETVASFYCGMHPNNGLDPIRHLMLGLWMRGVKPGNVSVVQIEVQPAGKRSSEAVYVVNATVGFLAMEYGGTASTSQPLYVRFMASRENLTATDTDVADTRPLTTAREHYSTLFATLPRIPKPPSKIQINQAYSGASDVGGWMSATKALKATGFSGVRTPASPLAKQIFDAVGSLRAGVPSCMLSQGQVPNVSKRCGPWTKTTPIVGHCWGSTDEEVALGLQTFAEATVGPLRAVGFTKLTGCAMHDELEWGYPGIWHGNNNISGSNPRVFKRYHEYIQNNSGLTTPQDFGAGTWEDVVPITMANVTGGKHWQGLRQRVYWSVRFIGFSVATWFAEATKALVVANNGEPFSTYTCVYDPAAVELLSPF